MSVAAPCQREREDAGFLDWRNGSEEVVEACRVHRQEEGHIHSDAGLSLFDISEKAILPVPMALAALLLPWLLSAVEERFGFYVSTRAEVISPTSAARSDWRLLRTSGYGWVRSPIRCPDMRATVSAVLSQFPISFL